jgi:Kelch motif protein
MNRYIVAAILTCVPLFSTIVSAQVPGVINCEGRIVDNGTNFNGTGQFEFALINTGGTTNYWANDGTAVGQPANAIQLTVTKGLYSVLLGNTAISNMTVAISPSVVYNSNVLLRVWFNDGVKGFQQLTPDQRVASVGYALVAATVPNGAIGSAQLTSNAVTTANFAPGSVTASELASNTITAANFAANSITPAQIALGYGLVPSGSLVLSSSATNPALMAAGFAPLLSYPSWTEATNLAPWSGRYGFGAVAYNGQMWVMGGVNSLGNPTNDVWSSSNGVTWTRATSAAAWSGRYAFGVVVFNGQMWVIGGYGGISSFFNDVWSSTNGVTWTQATGLAPWSARGGLGAIALNSQLWVMGGQTANSSVNDVWSSTNGVAWARATNAAPWSAREEFGAMAFNGQMWVMGGYGGGSLGDVWASSNGVTWTELTNAAPWSGRQLFGAVPVDAQMWIMGGQNNAGGYLNDVWSSSDGLTWLQATNSVPWSGRYGLGALALNGQMWVMGGDVSSGLTNDVWQSPSSTNMVGSYFLYQKQ